MFSKLKIAIYFLWNIQFNQFPAKNDAEEQIVQVCEIWKHFGFV